MQLQDLTYLLQNPEAITSSQTEMLAKKIKEYPYFQPLHALYLKGLKQKESYKYNNALKTTAAHTTDRSVLFDYITSEVFNQNEISQHIKQTSEYIKSISVNEVDDETKDWVFLLKRCQVEINKVNEHSFNVTSNEKTDLY